MHDRNGGSGCGQLVADGLQDLDGRLVEGEEPLEFILTDCIGPGEPSPVMHEMVRYRLGIGDLSYPVQNDVVVILGVLEQPHQFETVIGDDVPVRYTGFYSLLRGTDGPNREIVDFGQPVCQYNQGLGIFPSLFFGAVYHEERDLVQHEQNPAVPFRKDRLDHVLQDILGLGRDLRLHLEVLGVEAPELVPATALVFGGIVLLDRPDEVVDLLELVVVEEVWVAQKPGQILPVPVEILGDEPVGQEFHRIERDVLAEFEMNLLLDGIQDVFGEPPSSAAVQSHGSAAGTDKRLHGDEDALLVLAALRPQPLLPEPVQGLPPPASRVRLLLPDDLPRFSTA